MHACAFAGNFFWFMFAVMTSKTSALLLAPTLLLAISIATLGAPQTVRLDYYHTGNSKQEVFSLDHVVVEPLPWPGDMSKTIDTTNLGKYLFEVRDKKSNRLLYSRGF